MNNDKVLLLEPKERTSALGNKYMSGWLGKASVVAFLDKDAAEATWQVYAQTPTSKPAEGIRQRSACPAGGGGFQRSPRRASNRVPAGMLDDDISDIAHR
jgi:hypothetical protein